MRGDEMKYSSQSKATATIRGGGDYPGVKGLAKLFRCSDGTLLEVEVSGLPETDTGFFALHIHEGENCAGKNFAETGIRWNPGKTMHLKHAGDLPPLLSNHGTAYMMVFSDRFFIEEIIGKTVIIHSLPDDFRTQPSGNAGTKIACGVIQKIY